MGIYHLFEAVVASLPLGERTDAESASESKDQDDDSKPEQQLKEGEDAKGKEGADESSEGGDDAEDKDGGDEDEAEDAEEEEEEEEPEDPKAKLEEDCKNSSECKKYKSHYDACAARVDDGAKEDCVEEFFELAHCATNCAAPKLWKLLK